MTTNIDTLTNAIKRSLDIRDDIEAYSMHFPAANQGRDDYAENEDGATGGASGDMDSISETIFSIILEQDPDRVTDMQKMIENENGDEVAVWKSLLRVGDLITFNVVFNSENSEQDDFIGKHKPLTVDVTIEICDHADSDFVSLNELTVTTGLAEGPNKLIISDSALDYGD